MAINGTAQPDLSGASCDTKGQTGGQDVQVTGHGPGLATLVMIR